MKTKFIEGGYVRMRMATICKRIAVITMITLVVGFALMLVAYALPVGRMKNNIVSKEEQKYDSARNFFNKVIAFG